MRKYTIILSLSFVFFFYSVSASAGGCGCGGVRAIVGRAESNIITKIADTKSTVILESNLIQGQITQAAINIIGTMKTNNALVLRAIQDHKETTANTLKGLVATMESQKTMDYYGPGSIPNNMCQGTTVGAGIQVTSQVNDLVRAGLQKRVGDYISYSEKKKPVEYIEELTAEDHPLAKEASTFIFPEGKTLSSDDFKNADKILTTTAVGIPTPPMSARQQRTPAGEGYTALKQIHDTRVQLNAEALSKHISYHEAADIPEIAQWAMEQWKAMGNTDEPPGVINGEMSLAALYNLLSQTRVGNPNWFVDIGQKNPTGLMREMVMIQALQLEMTRQNNELLSRISVGLAIQNSIMLDEYNKKHVEPAYIRAIGVQQ